MKMTKTLPAALGAALILVLAACSSPADITTPSPITSSFADNEEDPTEDAVPVVDRDPQGPLPTITFDADGIPTMSPVAADPPEVISVKTLQAGTGATVGETDFITVHYAGFLWSDGTEFDSSIGSEPISFLLNEMVEGWVYGLAGTKVGDRVLLVVPPDYGYGDLEDEVIPPGATLVFVVDILNAVVITTDALKEATPTGAALPEGVTVSGELGQEPTLVFADGAPEPTEPQTLVIAKGNGPLITETDTLLYHVVSVTMSGESYSSWPDLFEQAEFGGGDDTIGLPVGSRLLLIYPAEAEYDMEAEAIVLDLLAVVPGE